MRLPVLSIAVSQSPAARYWLPMRRAADLASLTEHKPTDSMEISLDRQDSYWIHVEFNQNQPVRGSECEKMQANPTARRAFPPRPTR